ncbi:MAG: hypothetical protein [Bacteriophage sp.]|nr:MAG: hypothetical protein [Bacteriophage sp.]
MKNTEERYVLDMDYATLEAKYYALVNTILILANDGTTISGYHLNGDLAEWEEIFPYEIFN